METAIMPPKEELFTLGKQTIWPRYSVNGGVSSSFISMRKADMNPETQDWPPEKWIARTREEYEAELRSIKSAEVLAERERCAQIVESGSHWDFLNNAYNAEGKKIVDAEANTKFLAAKIREGK